MLLLGIVSAAFSFVAQGPSAGLYVRHHARSAPPAAIFDKLFGGATSGASAIEERLLASVSNGGSIRDALDDFAKLETAAPSSENLLRTEAGTTLLDGRWLLRSTIAASVGDDESLAATGISNAVNASGIVVDASAARAPVQEVDVGAGRIGNEIRFAGPFGAEIIVRVAGGFAPDAVNGRRAVVSFDTLDVFLMPDGAQAQRLVRAGALFSVVRAVRPALTNGASEESWLDTTYISDRCRLGRGNKGSVFILERDDDEGPLSRFAL